MTQTTESPAPRSREVPVMTDDCVQAMFNIVRASRSWDDPLTEKFSDILANIEAQASGSVKVIPERSSRKNHRERTEVEHSAHASTRTRYSGRGDGGSVQVKKRIIIQLSETPISYLYEIDGETDEVKETSNPFEALEFASVDEAEPEVSETNRWGTALKERGFEDAKVVEFEIPNDAFEPEKVAKMRDALEALIKAKNDAVKVYLENWGYPERGDTSEYEENLVENVENEIRRQMNADPDEMDPYIEEVIQEFGEIVETQC